MYTVEYRDQRCEARLTSNSLSVTVPTLSTGLDVMESAANAQSQYMFTAQYFSNLGYLITIINGTEIQPFSPSDPYCSWLIFIVFPNGTEIRSGLGVADFCLPSSGYEIIWRYITVFPPKALVVSQ